MFLFLPIRPSCSCVHPALRVLDPPFFSFPYSWFPACSSSFREYQDRHLFSQVLVLHSSGQLPFPALPASPPVLSFAQDQRAPAVVSPALSSVQGLGRSRLPPDAQPSI